MLPFVTTHGQTLVEGAAERLRWAITARWPQAPEHDVALLAECLVRLAISYATLPVAPAGMTASSIAELLGPFIDHALAAETGVSAETEVLAETGMRAAGECPPASVDGVSPAAVPA